MSIAMQSQHTKNDIDSNKNIQDIDNHNNVKKKLCVNMDYRICNLDNNDDDDEKFKDIVVGRNERMLTDPYCLLIFILSIIIDVSICIYANGKGANTEYLYKGHDYNGNICNYKTSWFNTNITFIDITRCTNNCNNETIKTYIAETLQNHWCVPNKNIYDNTITNVFDFNAGSATYARLIVDLITQWNKIELICWCSIIISFIYFLFIKYNLRLLAYIIMNIIFGFIASIILIYHGKKDIDDPTTDDKAYFEVIEGIVILILALMMGIYFIRDREALLTDIEMMAEAKEVSFLFIIFMSINTKPIYI